MKISLINPPQTELKEPFSYIPLGLGYLASSLIKEGFEDVRIDNLAGIGLDNIKLDFADIFGISYMSAARDGVKRTIDYIREKYPESRIIIGGPHPSVDPIGAYVDINPDILIAGEGERLFPKLVNKIYEFNNGNRICNENNRNKNNNWNKISSMYNAGVIEDLDSLPFPARQLFEFDNVVSTSGIHGCEKGVNSSTLITSRGCPFDCKFCCREHQMYSKYRYRSPENVRDELIELKEDYGVQHVRFVDDCFTLVRDRVKGVCKCTKKLGITFMCITRADTSNLDTLKMLKDGGCTVINIGVESGSNRLLSAMNKRETVDQIKKCIFNAKKVGLKTKVLLQYNLPGEIAEDWSKTLSFLKEAKPNYYTLSKFVPLPGSEWWKWNGVGNEFSLSTSLSLSSSLSSSFSLNGWFYNDNDKKRNRLINEIESILYG